MFVHEVTGCTVCSDWLNVSIRKTSDVHCVTGVLGATHVEIEQHLEMGRKLLAAGQLAEALSHYHSAVGVAHLYTHALHGQL